MAWKDQDNPNRIILYNLGDGERVEIYKADKPTLKKLYHQELLSLQEIANKYKTTRPTIYKWLKEYDIPRRDKSEARQLALRKGKFKDMSSYIVNENFFDEWSPEMAWVLGIVITDGNIHNNYLQIPQRYPEILYKIRDLMNSDKKIYRTTNTNGKPLYMLGFWNKKIISKLCNLGIEPRKSLITKFPNVPIEYLRHFLRGIFDGDGSASSNRVRFYTGSKRFALSLSNIINSVLRNLIDLPYDPCKIYTEKNRKGYVIYLCQKDAIPAFYSFLYKDVPVSMYYSLKKEAFDKLIKRNKDSNLLLAF